MVQLALLVAMVAALVLAEGASNEPVANPQQTLTGAVLLVGTLAFLSWGGAAAIVTRLRYEPEDRDDCRRWFGRLENVHFALWAIASAVLLYVLQWPRFVRANCGLEGSFLLDEVVVLAPILLPPLIAWAAYYDIDLALVRAADPDLRPPQLPAGWLPRLGLRLQYVWHQARLSLGLVLLPAIALISLHDAAEWFSPGISHSSWAATIYLPPVIAGALLTPVWFRLLWPTTPLERGPLRYRLEMAAERAGYPIGEILVWETHGTQANAAILGYAPPFRYVLLTDLLLELLNDDEIEAVFRHELAHLSGGHLWIRLGVLAAPLVLLAIVQTACPQLGPAIEQWLVSSGIDVDLASTLLWPAMLCAYCIAALGWCSRELEHEADLAACLVPTNAPGSNCDPGQTAALHLGRALERLTVATGGDRRAATWLHPSLDERLEFLALADEHSVSRAGAMPRYVVLGGCGLLGLAWLVLMFVA